MKRSSKPSELTEYYKAHLKRAKGADGKDLLSEPQLSLETSKSQSSHATHSPDPLKLICRLHPGKKVVALSLDPTASNKLLCVFCLQQQKHQKIVEISECFDSIEVNQLSDKLLRMFQRESVTEDPVVKSVLTQIETTFESYDKCLQEIKENLIDKIVQKLWKTAFSSMNYSSVQLLMDKITSMLEDISMSKLEKSAEFWTRFSSYWSQATECLETVRDERVKLVKDCNVLCEDLKQKVLETLTELENFVKERVNSPIKLLLDLIFPYKTSEVSCTFPILNIYPDRDIRVHWKLDTTHTGIQKSVSE